jgi:ribosomal protein S18 acetylase RimI-like enzyme
MFESTADFSRTIDPTTKPIFLLGAIMTTAATATGKPIVRALAPEDLPEAARIIRHAFGTFFGVPDLETFWTDRDYAFGRHAAAHIASFGAVVDGKLAGSNFVTNWGSVGFFGPLSVRPDVQARGIARALLSKTMEQFDAWDTRQVGLFTFAQSAKHIALYQKYGFYARFLTAIMETPAERSNAGGWSRFSALSKAQQDEVLHACRDVAETVYPGLDLTGEIRAIAAQKLGDTVLLEGTGGISGFAVCHYGPRSEAGADTCYVKFGVVRAGPKAAADFSRLLDACEALAVAVGMPKLLAGANMAREEAYRMMVSRGFRTAIQGVSMHRHNDPGYCRPGVYVIDDWR